MKEWVLRSAVLGISLVFFFSGPLFAQSELIERGRYLVEGPANCGNCHTPKDRQGNPIQDLAYSGGFRINLGPPGIITVTNITPDRETGIGAWTDEQIITAIREGKRPDGDVMGPPMPIELYRDMADEDVKAIVAYLRTFKPIRNPVPRNVYKIPKPPSYGPPVGKVSAPPRTDKVKYGAYLFGPMTHCAECHTPMEKGKRLYETRLGGGGFPFLGPWGTIFGANVTPDRETGVGAWTDQQLKDAITKGIERDGSKLIGPMPWPWYAKMTSEDLDAIVAYMRTMKPIRNKVEPRLIPPKN
jgi:mono/diheme cytochrome c family protein